MTGNTTTAEDSAERRNFFRIDDSVSMSYQQISEQELEGRIGQMDMELEGNFTVMGNIASINQNMAVIMHRIEGDEPDIAAYLKAINKKIDILGRALISTDNYLTDQSAQPVNLSASGMAFYTSKPLDTGIMLELRLLLMPSFTGIITFCEVVGCDRVDDVGEGFSFFTRVNFTHMRENDRDLLIRHVIKRQGEFLRKRREQNQ
jgi:PilZ domain